MQGNLSFRLMSLAFRLRDRLRPPALLLQEAGVRPGMTLLDFGCGPGSFAVAAAELVGPEGRVYALDINPLALQSVERGAARRGLRNLHPLSADELAAVQDGTVDLVLLYDVLHDLPDPAPVLAELRRVLKPDGSLSVNDHHLKGEELPRRVTAGGLFRMAEHGRWSHRFQPV
jgi:ubiquinone/menaquinone biosynthesis C-methylase UbiE